MPSYCDEFVERNLTGLRVDGTSPISSDSKTINIRFNGLSSFAIHNVALARSSIKVSNEVPIELLGPLGCDLTTGVGSVMNAL